MKKSLITLVLLASFFTTSCEDKDTTPPEITVTNLENGLHVYGNVLIELNSTDNEGVEYVELIVDASPTAVTDSVEPYILEWNTDNYELGRNYSVQCRAYDINGNYKDSESFDLFVEVTFIKFFNGGSGDFLMESVQQTADAGYILTGRKNGGVWLFKADASGEKEWEKFYEGYQGTSVQQTTDGGYVITGRKGDVLLLKTDKDGVEEWSKSFGGTGDDWGDVVQETADGGYIISGGTESFTVGHNDVWVIKTDGSGNEEWNKTFGTEYYNSWRTSVRQTTDGGYITYMGIHSLEGNLDDVELIKLNANGEEEWSKILGSPEDDWLFDIDLNADGSFIGTGIRANGVNHTWLVNIDSDGTVRWEKTFGGSSGISVTQTSEGGYIVSGYARDTENDLKTNLIKTDGSGNEEWSKTFPGKEGNVVQPTADGGYILAAIESSGSPSGIFLIKTNSQGQCTEYVGVID